MYAALSLSASNDFALLTLKNIRAHHTISFLEFSKTRMCPYFGLRSQIFARCAIIK